MLLYNIHMYAVCGTCVWASWYKYIDVITIYIRNLCDEQSERPNVETAFFRLRMDILTKISQLDGKIIWILYRDRNKGRKNERFFYRTTIVAFSFACWPLLHFNDSNLNRCVQSFFNLCAAFFLLPRFVALFLCVKKNWLSIRFVW